MPWLFIGTLLALWVINATLLGVMSIFPQCSLEYYIILGSTYPMFFLVIVNAVPYLAK
jgi:hypothetical protein